MCRHRDQSKVVLKFQHKNVLEFFLPRTAAKKPRFIPVEVPINKMNISPLVIMEVIHFKRRSLRCKKDISTERGES